MQFNHFDKAFSSAQSQPNVSESDAKEFRKKLRNRQSAQRARDRQKARMRWLERQVEILNIKNQQLQSENNFLKSYVSDGAYAPYLRTVNSGSHEESEISNGKSLNPSPLYSPSCDRAQNEEGRVHMKIIKSEEGSITRDNDKVAVSPISRNNLEVQFEWPPKHIHEQVGSHNDSDRLSPSPVKLPDKIPKRKLLEDPPYGLSPLGDQHASDPFLAMQLLRGKYPGLLPYFMCPTVYDPGLTLANIAQHPSLLSGMRVGIYPENATKGENTAFKELELRGVCDLTKKNILESWNTSVYANNLSYSNLSYKRSRKADAEDQTMTEIMKYPQKRQKTNSFESDCSSPMSSETDSSTHAT